MDIPCRSVCIQLSITCIYLTAPVIRLVTLNPVMWRSSVISANTVFRCLQHVRKQQWQTDGNFCQYNLSTTHLTLQSYLLCSFLLPLWFMCPTLLVLPSRQEQLTASPALPQVPKMTQSNRIRFCIWGGGCFCASVLGHRESIHEVVCFLANLFHERRKVQQFGWVDALAVSLLWKTTLGRKIGICGGDSFQSATMLYLPKAEISS